MAVNCSLILLNSSWMLVLLPINVADILSPRGGMSHAAVFTLFGIHSTKYVLKNKQKTVQIKIFLLQRTSESAIIPQPATTRFINSLHLTLQIIYLFLFWTFSICSSTSFMDIFPRNMAATVRYLPCLGSHAAIMFLLSNICCVNSFTVSARYCWLSRLVNGAKPGIKKWRRGNGTMLTASFLRSAFSCRKRRDL